jgi:gas vesicle protein
MPDYSLCKVYKIISNQTDKVYIGSTCQELSQRLADHRQTYNRYLKGKTHYVSSFEILKYPDAKIILVQSYQQCQSNMEKLMYEQCWIDCYDCVNKYRAYLSTELAKEKKKEYNEVNKNQIYEKKKEYYEENKEQILENAKEYRKNNKEQIAEIKKEYYKNNKELINEKRKKKVKCDCGKIVHRGYLSKHKTSNIHKKLLNNLS